MSASGRAAIGTRRQQGPHPAAMSLQREVSSALDTTAPPAARAASFAKLHAVMASHKANRPAVAVAMLPWFLSSWPALVACLWDHHPQIPVAVAPLLGLIGGLVASSRPAAAAAALTTPTAAQPPPLASPPDGPRLLARPAAAAAVAPLPPPPAAVEVGVAATPPPPPGLLFDWLLPLLTGKVPLPAGHIALLELQVLICKTLVYALQQLPSCSPAATAPEPATAVVPFAAGLSATTTASTASYKVTGSSGQSGLLVDSVANLAAEQLHQHAAAVLAAVEEVLEVVATPPELLAPLLHLLLEVVRMDASVITGAAARDLLDLLLGWSLEPGLQSSDRSLIARVISACKLGLLAGPQLVVDVGSKLLSDLRQLLPTQHAKGVTDSRQQQEQQPQQQEDQVSVADDAVGAGEQDERQQKFIALLSCLVAMLTAVSGVSSCQQLLIDTAAFMHTAHGQYHELSKDSAAHSEAAVAVAGLLLALLEEAAASSKGVMALIPSASSSPEQGVANSVRSTAFVPGSCAGKGSGAADSLPVVQLFSWAWSAASSTLQLPLLSAAGAKGLLGSMSNALKRLAADDVQEQQHDPVARQQQQHQEHSASLADHQLLALDIWTQLMEQLFSSTVHLRHTPFPEVQAALAALYTVTAIYSTVACSSAQKVPATAQTLQCQITLKLQGEEQQRHAKLQNNPLATVLAEVFCLVEGLCGQSAGIHPDSNASATLPANGVTALSQQQMCAVLFFDFVLLDGWLINSGSVLGNMEGLMQQYSSTTGTSGTQTSNARADAVGIAPMWPAGSLTCIAGAMLIVLQQLASSNAAAQLPFWADIAEQMLAVVQAVVAVNAGQQSAVQPTLLAYLQQLLQATELDQATRIAALQLLPELLQQEVDINGTASIQQTESPVQQSASALCDIAVLWPTALHMVATSTGSSSFEERKAAVEVAGKLAHLVWRPREVDTLMGHLSQQQPNRRCQGLVGCATVPGLLQALLQMVASCCSDLDQQVAAAAQAHIVSLAIPLYHLLAAGCCRSRLLVQGANQGGDGTTLRVSIIITSSSDSSSQERAPVQTWEAKVDNSTAAGDKPWALQGYQWWRTAALQPQQRAFSPAQLADLFELVFQAPAVSMQQLQSDSAAVDSGDMLDQQQHTQTKALHQLANALPAAPGPSSSSSISPSRSRAATAVSFETLNSAAALNWLLLQEAARQCVNARMRTHMGNPLQSFSGVDRMVQATLQKLQGLGSAMAVQRSWQQHMIVRFQAVSSQQQQHLGNLKSATNQQQPQQLLQAPAAVLASRAGVQNPQVHAAASLVKQPQPSGCSRQQGASTAGLQLQLDGIRAAERQQLEAESAAGHLLDFLHALEVNVQSAVEGSLLRPSVSKPVMAFFAANKKVCDEWFARARESMLLLSAAAGAHQHVMHHGMVHLQEMQANLKSITTRYQAELQQLQQQQKEQQEQTSRLSGTSVMQGGSSNGATGDVAAAAAAAAAAISGLNAADRKGRTSRSERQGRQNEQQQAAAAVRKQDPKLKLKQDPTELQNSSSNNSQAPACNAAALEKRQLLEQHYQASVLRLSAPLLSTLCVLVNALIEQREGRAITGLQAWTHSSFQPVWRAVSRFYALELSTEGAEVAAESMPGVNRDAVGSSSGGCPAGTAPNQVPSKSAGQGAPSTMMLLLWLPGAAAQADGRYETALQLYMDFSKSAAVTCPLGLPLQDYVLEQMAACYATVQDWQGLAGVCSNNSQQVQQQQQQQQTAQLSQQRWAHRWALAGRQGLAALQQWQVALPRQPQQLQQQTQQIAQYIMGDSSRRDRSSVSSLQALTTNGLPLLDPADCRIPGLSAAGIAIVNALAVLQSDRPGTTDHLQQRQPHRRGQKRPGRGRGQCPDEQDETQHSSDTQQQMLSAMLSEVTAQLQSSAEHIMPAVSDSWPLQDPVIPASCSASTGRLAELSLLQLVQQMLLLKAGGAREQQQQQQANSVLGGVRHLVSSLCRSQRSRLDSSSSSTSSNCWQAAFNRDGRLAASCLDNIGSTMPLVQVLSAVPCTAGQQQHQLALCAVVREALLACHSTGCTSTQHRLLQLAESKCALNSEDALWFKLLKSNMLTANEATQERTAVLLQMLSQHLPLRGSSDVADASMPGSSQSAAIAAAFAALAVSVATTTATMAAGAAAASVQLSEIDWNLLQHNSLQALEHKQGQAVSVGCSIGVGATDAVPQQHIPAAGCLAAAAAAAPAEPGVWEAYGDFLYSLVEQQQQGAKRQQQGAQQQQPGVAGALSDPETQLMLAAAEAYCNHLAAAVNSSNLNNPDHGLGILLRLLHIILNRADALQQQLQEALGACPAAVWQVLTPQLIGHLQHTSGAVRGLVQLLLQGLAAVVPCAVLYPLIVELRAAQEAGHDPPAELSAVLVRLQADQPRLLADATAMAAALERLTVTTREAWTGLLEELELEVNRKLLALQADAARQVQQGVSRQKRIELLTKRYNTVMAPVLRSLQQQLAAAAAGTPASLDEADFRRTCLPQLQGVIQQLSQPPAELLKLVQEQQDAAALPGQAATADTPPAASTVSTWNPLKQLHQQMVQQLRRQHQLQLSSVAPLLASLKDTSIPLPSDETMACTLPCLPLKAALVKSCDSAESSNTTSSDSREQVTGGSVLLSSAMGTATIRANGAGRGWLCIAGFDQAVLVLPTKTRPKRIRLLADDGSVHAFLLKGRDDLRVDERLMQFIRAANALLETPVRPCALGNIGTAGAVLASDCGSSKWQHQQLRLRPYSITPFGRRAGLLQWVRHTMSLFGLFRNWQAATTERYHAVAAAKQEAAAAAAPAGVKAAAGGGDGRGNETTAMHVAAVATAINSSATSNKIDVQLPLIIAATRPADAFYARLLPALQAAGVPVGAPRSSWPSAVLRSTLLSLAREAPKNLLARQLLSNAASPAGWWSSLQTFTASAAAGSVVGWLLGLGDRHLDNLLLDYDTGELLHIDFSVCFDKGAGLAVPEVVPFRLTQMMQVALGPGGLDGPFTAAACTVLDSLRSSSDLLTSLLELLLSDPAVDWSADREAHAARKDRDTSVSLNLFASRMQEVRQPLLASLAATLPVIGDGLAAIVSYGEAHIYMKQLKDSAAGATALAAAAQAAIAAAADQEVSALAERAEAAQTVASLMSDYRRLCGLAGSVLESARSWLDRHGETLQALTAPHVAAAAAGASPHEAVLAEVLGAGPSVWQLKQCNRQLMLVCPNASDADNGNTDAGLLAQALGSLLADVPSSERSSKLADLLPVSVYQQCLQLDSQGQALLSQHQVLIAKGGWALQAYSMLLRQLLPGNYLHHNHHWAWCQAFQAAMAGPDKFLLATATATTTAPQVPLVSEVQQAWACLAACWMACKLQQEQCSTATAAAAIMASSAAEIDMASSAAVALASRLGGLVKQLGTISETNSAVVQLVASRALLVVAGQVHAAAQSLQDLLSSQQDKVVQVQQGNQLEAAVVGAAGSSSAVVGVQQPSSTGLCTSCSGLQHSLAVLQTALLQYQQAGLSYIIDLSTSAISSGLPEAAGSLDELMDDAAADADDELLHDMQQQQQFGGLQQQHQWISNTATQLQLLHQLLSAMQYEAIASLSAWAAAPGCSNSTGKTADDAERLGTLLSNGANQPAGSGITAPLVLVHAGPVSHWHPWLYAASLVDQTWQALQQQLQQARQLEQRIQTLAAVAAAGGLAGASETQTTLLAQVEQLQQALLLQGFDISTADGCIAAAQLQQWQWAELEQAVASKLGICLCQLLGVAPMYPDNVLAEASKTNCPVCVNSDKIGNGPGLKSAVSAVSKQDLAVLRQLQAAATASISSGAIMHSKDVIEALAGLQSQPSGNLTAAGSDPIGGTSGHLGTGPPAMWGTPCVSEAWRSLVVLLLQSACLQQQALQHGQQYMQHQNEQQDKPSTAAAAGSNIADVLNSCAALPLDLEQYRPLVFVVQVLHGLLSTVGDPVHDRLQRLVVPAVMRSILPHVQQRMSQLPEHLQALGSEAEQVLHRHCSPDKQQTQSEVGKTCTEQGNATMDQGPATVAKQAVGDSLDSKRPELVPFNAFDESLPGANIMLEELEGDLEDDAAGLTSGQDSQANTDLLTWLLDDGDGQGSQSDGSAAEHATSSTAALPAMELSELVPFDAFDFALPGAGALLEDEGSALEDKGAAGESEQSANPGSMIQDTAAEVTGMAEAACNLQASAADWQLLGEELLAVGGQQAQELMVQQTLVGLQQVAPSCEWQQQTWLHHLAAFEWIWGDMLHHQVQLQGNDQGQATAQQCHHKLAACMQAAASFSGLPSPSSHFVGQVHLGNALQYYAAQTGLLDLLPAHPDNGRSAGISNSRTSSSSSGSSSSKASSVPSRQQLLEVWVLVTESAAEVEAGLQGWQQSTNAAVGAISDEVTQLVVRLRQQQQGLADPSVYLKVLSGLLARSHQWVISAAGILRQVSNLSEAAVQLEYSRRGKLWAPGVSDGVDAFQGNAALLQQLQTVAAAFDRAQAQASTAEAALLASQAAAQQAQVDLDESLQEAAAIQQEIAVRTPAALARAQALRPVLNPMVVAAESALPLVTEDLGSTLKALSALVERNAAVSDLAPIAKETTVQHARCVAVLQRLHDVGAAVAAGLNEALQQHQQPQQQAVLLDLLLENMQPALQGLKEELKELGQAHILFTRLVQQLDGLASAAETVAAAITAEHAVQLPTPASRLEHIADEDSAASHASTSSGSGNNGRRQRAEARRKEFAIAALARCKARLTGAWTQGRKVGSSTGSSTPADRALMVQDSSGTAQVANESVEGSNIGSIGQEVAALIAAATSADKLSRMYEGWAAWL